MQGEKMWPQPAPLGLRPLHFNNPESVRGVSLQVYNYKIVMSGKLNFCEIFNPHLDAPPAD